MSTPLEKKSTLEEIRVRFDADVERFSNLETGQQAMLDARLVLELVAKSCAGHLKAGDRLLDLGCGAGNFTLSVLRETPQLHCHLVDLSQPMLTRASERLGKAKAASAVTSQSDLRTLLFEPNSFDVILAGAVLHHLRDDDDWTQAFARFHRWLRPGGRIYVADVCNFGFPDVQELMWRRYADHLESIGGADYRDKVMAYVDKEDSPRPLIFQLDLLKTTGFSRWDVLHRNGLCACYVGAKWPDGP
jgi:tRNA (cmo5U34)-methyltransferase